MTTTSNSENYEYIGKNTRWFMGFIPSPVFDKLDPQMRKYYQGYRRNQRFIGRSQQKVESIEEDIKRLQNEIQKEKSKQKDWEEKLKMFYDELSYLDEDFRFSCSVEYRKRRSRKEGDPPYVYLYSKVSTTSKRITFYLGNEMIVKERVGRCFREDLRDNDRESFVTENLKVLIRGYSRYHIHKWGWDKLGKKSLNLDVIIKWVDKVGMTTVYQWAG